MFLPNPINEQPKIEADSQSLALMVALEKSKSEFAAFEQFSDWIDEQLSVLEKKFVDFETESSRRPQFHR